MIYIDASRYNNTAKRTGVENYSYFLINELIKLAPKDITLISPRRTPAKVKQIIIPFPRLWTLVRLSWEVLRNKKINNLFVPSHLLPLIHPKNSTITIHDVAFRHLPESYRLFSKIYLHWGTKRAVKRAKKIITPSETTKNDLVDLYKADPKKITAIPLGFEAKKPTMKAGEEKKIAETWKLKPETYFLYLGRIEHKKNSDGLLKAFTKFAEQNKYTKLVLAGSLGKGGKEVVSNIPPSISDRVVITGYVSEKEKHVLLKNALAFIFPSRYEGFGIPLLEAMSYHLPLIASKIPTSYEIAKESALFFEVNDTNALAKHMGHIVKDEKYRKKLTANHGSTLKKYSWEKAAKATYELIKV